MHLVGVDDRRVCIVETDSSADRETDILSYLPVDRHSKLYITSCSVFMTRYKYNCFSLLLMLLLLDSHCTSIKLHLSLSLPIETQDHDNSTTLSSLVPNKKMYTRYILLLATVLATCSKKMDKLPKDSTLVKSLNKITDAVAIPKPAPIADPAASAEDFKRGLEAKRQYATFNDYADGFDYPKTAKTVREAST